MSVTLPVRTAALILALAPWMSSCGERGEVAPTPVAPASEISKPPRAERTRRPSVDGLFNAPAKSDYESAVTSAIKVVV